MLFMLRIRFKTIDDLACKYMHKPITSQFNSALNNQQNVFLICLSLLSDDPRVMTPKPYVVYLLTELHFLFVSEENLTWNKFERLRK